jgi:hypothetical protein
MKQKIKRKGETFLRQKAGFVFYLVLFLNPLLMEAQTTHPVVYRSLSPKTSTNTTVEQMIHLDYGYFYEGLNIDLSGGIKANPGATNSSSITLTVYAYDESKADGKGARVFYCWATPQQLAATTGYVKSVENVEIKTLTGIENQDGTFFGYSTTSDDIKKIAQDVKAYIPNYCTSYSGTIFWRAYVKISHLLRLTAANPEDYCNNYLQAQQPVIVEISTSNLAAFKEAKVPGIIGGNLNVINSVVVTTPPSTQVDNTSICAQESGDVAVELTTNIKLWPNGDVSYFFDPASNFSVTEKKSVTDAMAEWVSAIGSNRIRFIEAASLSDAKMPIKRRAAGCSTELLGSPSTYAKLNTLNLSGTCDHISILHELGHILGLQHEHQRMIRSNYLFFPAKTYQYIFKNFRNIYNNAVYNLRPEKIEGYTDNFPFDITSIMFYASYPRNNIALRDGLMANNVEGEPRSSVEQPAALLLMGIFAKGY